MATQLGEREQGEDATDERHEGEASVEADPRFDVASSERSFEHRRIVSTARQRLFGRGQPVRIGRYEVERRLGAGGMGEVYLARDPELNRKVAVKRVLARFGPRHQDRLRGEARGLARLSHPNVVQVYEFGEHEGRTFVAMEYVDGQTLGKWLTHGAPSWQAVLAKFIAAGRGLAAVHEAGLVHRDFKPDNVLLGADGRVLVADFGLVLAGDDRRAGEGNARALGSDLSTSVTGAILGTIRYMSLEQLRGGEIDARSDQFSYCVALYEALWAKPPFSLASSLARLDALELGEPEVPSAREGLRAPARLWRVIRRGLSREPEARWPDMHALLEALEGETRRRRRTIGFGSAGVVVALAIAAWIAQVEPALDPCAAVERELDGVWDAERRAELERGLAELEVDHAADSRERVVAGLDRWSSGWQHERERVCRAEHEQRLEPELARRQSLCLTRQRQRVEDLVDLLLEPSADGDALAGAVEAVADLPSASACADELALLGVDPPGPAIADEVELLRRELGRARELRLLGRLDEALTLAEQSERAARELGYGPLRAEASAELAKAELAASLFPRGAERMQAAIDDAELHRHDALAAGLWLELALHTFTHLDDPRLGAWQLRRAEVANARIGVSPRVAARLAFAGAQLAELRADAGAAEQGYRAAIDEAELDDAARLDLPSYYANLARVVAEHDVEQALELRREAVAIAQTQYGPAHPETAVHLYELALALDEGEASAGEEVVGLLERVVAIWAEVGDRPHRTMGRAELLLARSALRRQDLDQAESHARAAMAIQAAILPEDHPERGETAHVLAVVASIRGDHEAALEHYLAALAGLESEHGFDDPRVQRVRSDIAATQLALGRIDDAAEGIAMLLPHVRDRPEHVSVRLQSCEIAVRRGQLELAASELDALDPATLGAHEFSYALLRALIEVREGELAPATLEGLHRALAAAPFTIAQVEGWFDQLELTATEREALQIE
ncbi:protein kinase domain-containing protein [Nannocystaceae bacterium ST9]